MFLFGSGFLSTYTVIQHAFVIGYRISQQNIRFIPGICPLIMQMLMFKTSTYMIIVYEDDHTVYIYVA